MRHPSVPLNEVLPTPDQVAQAVGNPLDPTGPAAVGSISLLPNGIRDSNDVEPLDCLGPATPLMRVVYDKGDVRQVALRDYARYGEGLTVSSVHTGVVRYSSDAEAARMFATFANQWGSCSGTRVSVRVTPRSSLDWTVTDVRESDGILTTTVLNADTAKGPAFPTEHSLGLVGNDIVDVDVAVTDAHSSRRVPRGRSAELVRVIRENINRSR